MALIVETGAGLSNAESYCSEAFATAYHAARANSDWTLVSNKEAALRKATEYMLQSYRNLWLGYRAVASQALDFPRSDVYLNDYSEPVLVADNIVPIEVQNACAELALKTYTDEELIVDTEDNVVMETIGPLSVKYSDSSADKYKVYSSVVLTLKPYLKNTGSRVIR
jgi:hypothetical protein